MPVTIKKPQAKKSDLTFRKWAIAAFFTAALFASAFAALINKILDSGKPAPTTVLFCAYCIYIAGTVTAAVMGIRAYTKEDAGAALFQGLLLLFSAITAIVNLRLAIVMLLESFGKSEMSKKIMGDQTARDFIASQRTGWILLAAGMAVCLGVGVMATVKLAKSRKQ